MMDEATLKNIAAQLACPNGDAGIVTAQKMNTFNQFITARALEHLAAGQGECVVEIGPGNGMLSAPLVQTLGKSGRYLGIELSEDMAQLAKTNLTNLASAQIDIHCGHVKDARINEGSIDAIMAVNVLYFIDDLPAFFEQCRNWLRPQSRAIFAVRSEKLLRSAPFARYGFIIRPLQQILANLKQAGFTHITTSHYDEGTETFEDIELNIDSIIIKASP